MKKTILTIVVALRCLIFTATSQVNTPVVKGQVIDDKQQPIPAASVRIKHKNITTSTDQQGRFSLDNSQPSDTLVISYVGYITVELPLNNLSAINNIQLKIDANQLELVEINTGYQKIPKERITGAFTQVDNKTINRSVSTNILDRLEGVTSGLLLNRGLPTGADSNNPKLSVRGRSTLFANAEPLIVVNGFPYAGTIDQINPADIENITVLKDAAAASIWGSRSGNGVIVITTKSGRKNLPLAIGLTSTLTASGKPDLDYLPQISSSDYIDLEQFLFSKGFYNSRFSNPRNAVSEAVEIFNQRKNGKISVADSAEKIDLLKSQDVRTQLEQYAYQAKFQQQYQLNIAGGSQNQSFYLSGGFDKKLENRVSDSYGRYTLNANYNVSLFKDRLSVSNELGFVNASTKSNTPNYRPFSPYDRIADDNGQALPVVFSTGGYRLSYVDTAGRGKLLDWQYRPLDELSPNSITQLQQVRIKSGLSLKLFQNLDLSTNYQYLNEHHQGAQDNDMSRFYTRNLINQYSILKGDVLSRVIPEGNLFRDDKRNLVSKIFRGQINYNGYVRLDHELNAIAGYEFGDTRSSAINQLFYGYDPETMTHANATIDPLASYSLYNGLIGARLTPAANLNSTTDISQSYFFNGAYAYRSRYMVSASARRDESNLFGVKANQKGVPLWSAGLAWKLSQEAFYGIKWLPELKLRLTYGYNGNVDRSLSAYLTALYAGPNETNGDLYSIILNPPNPSLRWEKTKTWNAGLDFAFANNRLSGSLDLYRKFGIDLIGNSPIAFQSGIGQFKGNAASLITRGIDLMLNSQNLTGSVHWNTSLLLNYNTDRVTKYLVKQSSNAQIISGNFSNPLEGRPYYAVYSFPFAGLDETGAPQGYLNGEISKDYVQIIGTLDPDQIRYHGSGSPQYFGNLINTFGWKSLELSFNISYKFDYYYRRSSVFSGDNYGFAATPIYALADYEKRWQQPGDELHTVIPALRYPANSAQQTFFQYSQALVEKGDHIRLQDIRLSWNLPSKPLQRIFQRAEVFVYGRDLGILWKASEINIDPDYGSLILPPKFSCSLGIQFNF